MHDDLAGIPLAHLADYLRVAPKLMSAHRREYRLRILRRNNGEQLSLVCAVHRVKPQHIAGCANLAAHGYFALPKLYAERRALDKFIERRRSAAARRVSQHAYSAACKNSLA